MVDPSIPSGSDAWTGGQEYEEEFAARIQYFRMSLNETALLQHASTARGGISCSLSEKFAVGSFNFVTKLSFGDGVEWIARLRMPPIEQFDENGIVQTLPAENEAERQRILYEMQSEIDTMEFVRLNSDIPVPKVYARNLTYNNPVGVPYSFIEYIHGSTAADLAATLPGNDQGIPEPYMEKITRQLAKVMHRLANLRLPKIGSIVHHNSRYEVDRLVETQSGPYTTASAFYQDYPAALAKSLYGENERKDGHEELVDAFSKVARTFSPESRVVEEEDTLNPAATNPRGFGLANYDLGPHNIIVDNDFNLLAVIDWDSVIAAPDAVLYRFPFLMGVGYAVPGLVEEHPACKAREQLGRQFAEIVQQTSSELASEDKGGKEGQAMLLTKAGFYSKEAVAFRALVHLKMKQDWVNREWKNGLDWLIGKSEKEVLEFYLTGQLE